MIVECPNCHNNIIPSNDNICPSCCKNINEFDEDKLNFTAMTFKENQVLPDNCYNCGLKTGNYKIIKRYKGKSSLVFNIVFSIICILFLPIGLIILIVKNKYRSRILIKIPVCESCQNSIEIKPKDVCFENFTMDFLVHKKFKELALKQ